MQDNFLSAVAVAARQRGITNMFACMCERGGTAHAQDNVLSDVFAGEERRRAFRIISSLQWL